MIITLELGSNFQRTIQSLTAAGRNLAAATSRGLGKAVIYAAGHVSQSYLTGGGDGRLNTRTGNLRKAVQGWKESDFEGVVGVRDGSAVDAYKYLLGGETKEITPKKGRLLAIPQADALTAAGVLKSEYTGGLRSIEGGFVKEIGGRLFFVIQPTERSRFRILFRLVPRVTVSGTDALAKGTLEAVDEMTTILGNEIAKELNN